jgi:hypothetical protein
MSLLKKDAAAAGTEKLKVILQAIDDIEEKNPKYWPDIEARAAKAVLELEDILIRSGFYEQPEIEGITVFHYGALLDRAEELHTGAVAELAALEGEISDFKSKLLAGGREGTHTIAPTALFSRLAKVQGLKYVIQETAKILEECKQNFERAKIVFAAWNKEHPELLALQDMLKGAAGKLGVFQPFSRHAPVDEDQRKSREAERNKSIEAAATYVEAAWLK